MSNKWFLIEVLKSVHDQKHEIFPWSSEHERSFPQNTKFLGDVATPVNPEHVAKR